jgi:hypothetical protein
MSELTENEYEYGRPKRSATTSNGKPWAWNTGKLASGIFYGWTIGRGIKAAQRRPAQPNDSDWVVPVHAAKVTGLWTVYVAMWIWHMMLVVTAIVLTIAATFQDLNHGGGVTIMRGALSLVLAIPATVVTVLCTISARALLARAEFRPPRNGERYLRWLSRKAGGDISEAALWVIFYFLPAALYSPFYTAVNLGKEY